MKKRSIKSHILVPTLLVLALGLLAQAWFMGRQSTQLAGDMSRQALDESAARYAAEFQAANSQALGALDAFIPMLAQAATAEDGRSEAIRIMRSYVKGEDNVLGMWVVYQPNAFDGRDNAHIGDTYHDASGAFMPYVFKVDGGVTVQPISEHDKAGYMSAADQGETVVGEPYRSSLDGEERLLYSLSIPIMKSGEVAGVLGLDMDLQAIASGLGNAPEQGHVFAVSPGGLIAAHPDRDMLMASYTQGWDEGFAGQLGEVLQGGAPAFIQGTHEGSGGGLSVSVATVPAGAGNWAICAAVPSSALTSSASAFRLITLGGGLLLFLLVLATMAAAAGRSLTELRKLTVVAGAIANGKFLSVNIQPREEEGITYNETELLRRSLASITTGMKRQYRAVRRMAEGDMTAELRPRSAEDSLNIALRDMARKNSGLFTDISDKVREINRGAGRLNGDVTGLAEQSRRGAKLAETLVKAAKTANNEQPATEAIQACTQQLRTLVQDMEHICESVAGLDGLANDMDNIARRGKDIAVELSGLAGRSADDERKRLGKLALQATGIYDLCNAASALAVGAAADSDDAAELARLIAADTLADLGNISGAIQRLAPGWQEAKPSRLAENLRRITVAVDTTQAEQAAQLAQQLAGEAGELDGLICRLKLQPKPAHQAIKLELKRLRQSSSLALPAERTAYKSAASAGS